MMMSDYLGDVHDCYTPLLMYMIDYPEATRLRGIISNSSSVTIARSDQLGDSCRHKQQWWMTTKEEIDNIVKQAHPVDEIKHFVRLCNSQRLTGMTHLIWHDWEHTEPAVALPFDILHSGYKFWSDHIFKWCRSALGDDEIDFRYKALAP
jgi:hypothetical protein